MQIANITRLNTAGLALEALETLELATGSDLAVRVHEAPGPGGRGVISLAGLLIPAQLPEGVTAGQKLTVRIVSAEHNEVTLQIQHEADPAATPAPGALARAAGALATSGDGRLVQIAAALQPQGLALPLPNGDVLTLAVPAEEEDRGGSDTKGGGEAAFVLHSAELGAIGVRLRLGSGSASIQVSVEPQAEELARAGASELRERIEAATGAATSVSVAARAADEPRPLPLPIGTSLDAYA